MHPKLLYEKYPAAENLTDRSAIPVPENRLHNSR